MALIHAGEIASPEAGLITASSGANFQHHAALIAGIAWQQGHFQALVELLLFGTQLLQLLLGQRLEFSVALALLQQLLGLLLLSVELLQPLVVEHQGLKPRAFFGQGQQLFRVSRHAGVSQLTLQGVEGAAGGF